MNKKHNLKKTIVGALLSGGVALGGLGLTAGVANAAPPPAPGPGGPVIVDHSDFGVPIVLCPQCQRTLPGDGSVRINPGNVAKLPGQIQVAIPSAGH